MKNYLQDNEIKKNIAHQFNRTLTKFQQISLLDSSALNVIFTNPFANINPLSTDFTDNDTNHLHLFIDFLEAFPQSFFALKENYPPDSNLVKRIGTVFMINAVILNAAGKKVFDEDLNLLVSSAESPGMGTLYGSGIQFNNLGVTPKGFTELMKATTEFLFDPKNDMYSIELKVLPAFFLDDYIFPKTFQKSRTYVRKIKNILTYTYNEKMEMLRQGEPVYEEIKTKGKKPEKYPEALTAAIKGTLHYSSSDFVFLKQEWRDVTKDKSYLLQLVTQIDPDNMMDGEQLLFTNFLTDNFHYLLLEKDTLATFNISKNISYNQQKIFPTIITNGYDSTSLYRIPGLQKEGWTIKYDYVLKGKLNKQDFAIRCSGNGNNVKEFYLDDQLVAIAQGKFSPEKFVFFDASLSSETLNQFCMIGFNRFLE